MSFRCHKILTIILVVSAIRNLLILLNTYFVIYIYIYSSAIKQLLETLSLSIKMCTALPTDVIWMNTMCAVSLAIYFRAVADVFRPLTTHQRYGITER